MTLPPLEAVNVTATPVTGLPEASVPFTGTPPSLNAVVGGHVNYVFADITSLPLIRSGQLRALAVTTPKRTPLLPEVPTFAEAEVSERLDSSAAEVRSE